VEVSGYHAISSGTARVAEIIDGKRTNAAPVVNIATGKMRPGHFYFPIATVARVSGSLEVTQHRSNDVEAVFVAPNALHLVNG
jgi:subtilase family serine protease